MSFSLLGSISLHMSRSPDSKHDLQEKKHPAHLHGYCHPACDKDDTVCAPERMPSSDSSRPSSSSSQGKAKLDGTCKALGQGTAFFTCAKNPNTLQS